jgi:DNA-binding NtrC family response regulator
MGDQVDRNPIHVYVVDDEKLIANTLALILGQNGYRAIGFTNPLEALESATAQPPAILISDVVMPGMNGIELAIEFTSRFPNCKVVLLSGHNSTEDLLDKAKEQGHDFTVLAKPIHPGELLTAIDMLALEAN